MSYELFWEGNGNLNNELTFLSGRSDTVILELFRRNADDDGSNILAPFIATFWRKLFWYC